jgi:teichuronic acid exporter
MSRRRALYATVGSGADLAARQATQFVVLLVLARIVTPAEFGTVALLAVFVSLGIVAADAGISTAVLQSSELTQTDVDTAFWTSVGFGTLLTMLGAALATPAAAAFGRPELAGLGAFLTLAVVGTAVGQVPNALLTKQQRFTRLLAVGSTAAAVSGTLAIAIALSGNGLWALAVQLVCFPSFASLLLLVAGSYRPRLRFERASARRLLALGRWVLAANLVDTAFLRLQAVVTGVVFGTAALGRYQRADSTQQLAAESTSNVFGRVALPLLAASSAHPDLLRAGMRTGVRATMAVNAPIMALLAALSNQVLVAFFGPQWASAAGLLSVLCIAGLLWPLHSLAINLLFSVGRNREVFRLDLVKKGIAIPLLTLGALVGLSGVAWAQVAVSLVALTVNAGAVHRAIGLPPRSLLVEAAAPVTLAVVVGLGVALLGAAWSARPLVETLVLGAGGMAAYLALAAALRLGAVRDVLPLLRRPPAEIDHD